MAELSVGPVVTPRDIEAAVLSTLRDSFPYYLSEVDGPLKQLAGAWLETFIAWATAIATFRRC